MKRETEREGLILPVGRSLFLTFSLSHLLTFSLVACTHADPTTIPHADPPSVEPGATAPPGDSDPSRDARLTFHQPSKPLPKDAATQDWPYFLGPNHNATTGETKLLDRWPDDGPSLVWEIVKGAGWASPVIAGERLVLFHRMNDRELVECLHPETGRRLWSMDYPTVYADRYGFNAGPRSSPVIEGDRVYTYGVAGMLHCLNLADGSVVWKRQLSEEFKVPEGFFGVGTTPLIEGNLLIINLGAPGGPAVLAIDRHTGRDVWKAGKQWGRSYASPVPAVVHGKRRVFVLTGGDSRPPTGGLLVIDPKDGRIEGRFPFRSKTYESVTASSPVVVGNQVFISTAYKTGGVMLNIAVDGSLSEAWRTSDLGAHWNTPIHVDGHLYGFTGSSMGSSALVCIEVATGKMKWRDPIEWKESVERNGEAQQMKMSPFLGSLLAADGRFICLGELGHLLMLDLSTKECKIRQRTRLFDARQTYALPVLSKGLLYIIQCAKGRDGSKPRLLCYDLRG